MSGKKEKLSETLSIIENDLFVEVKKIYLQLLTKILCSY